MKRSKLKNIINKSKELSKPTSAFDKFKNSLPEEVPVGYRLQAAWEAYGKPANYKEAVWLGLILPIDENTIKWPSIGYNEETDEYEYLNKGKDNETVAKDIRVWDNDVIPFVLELKRGGFIRVYNEEKDCWTYSKNPLVETFDPKEEVIELFLKGNKLKLSLENIPNFLKFDPETGYYVSKYYSDDDLAEDLKWYRSKESKAFRKKFKLNDLEWEDGTPDGKPFMYIPKKLYNDLYFKKVGYGFGGGTEEPEYYDPSGVFAGGRLLRKIGWNENGEMEYEDDSGEIFVNPDTELLKFKLGGQMSVIPEGALHARKNNMEGAGEDFTNKGIPVVDNKGEQQAEIERDEIIFRKEVTDKMEELYKKYNSEESSSKKDEIAIEMGKVITCEITKHTDDKTGLIDKILEKLNERLTI